MVTHALSWAFFQSDLSAMLYVCALIGFVGGFVAGQMLLMVLLRHKSNREILHDKALHWSYGLLNWVVAGFGAWAGISLYTRYFG